MKVYYNSSLWSKGKGFPGFPQRVNWEFKYAGTKCCIPVIYRFSKGIVFDIITLLDEAKLREFYDKYGDIEERLTPLQQRCVRQEHPYQSISIREVLINDKQVEEGYSSSSAISIPWEEQNIELVHIRKAYSSILKDTSCFACERFCVPYPEADSMAGKLKRLLGLDRVNSLKLSTYPLNRFYPLDIHFNISVREGQKEICFEHPVTGIHHTLYLQNPQFIEIPFGAGGNHSLYGTQAMYEIDPELSEGDTLQFDSSMQYTEPIEEGQGFAPTAASSIGIIGGADGPVSIFLSTKGEAEVPRGLNGLPLHNCISIPRFQKEDISHFRLEGINIKELNSQRINMSF